MTTRSFFISIFILLVFHQTVNAQSDATRLASLNKLLHAGEKSLISLTIDQFRKFVENAPRSYSLIVLFSADKQFCPHCQGMQLQLDRVASEYYRNPTQQSKSTHVFFVDVYISTGDQEFLMNYDIRHVPIVYHFSHGTKKAYPKPLKDTDRDNFPLKEIGFSSNFIKNFVNKRCRARMVVRRGGYKIMFKETIRKALPLLFFIAFGVGTAAVVTGAYKNPMLWFALVMLIYIYSVGGGHYSWIHDTPLLVVDNDGNRQYIARGSRSQYGAEGFMVSATCVMISVFIISIQNLPSIVPDKSSQNALGLSMVLMTAVSIFFLTNLNEMKMH